MIVIIGELSKRLSDGFKTKHALPWRQIAGLRDRAVHDYFSLDLDLLWQTVQKDLAPLETTLKKAVD